MSDPLGLSIGTTNLVAARVGNPPIVRRAVLSLFSDRAPQIGLPADNGAVTLTGFVERVGDPVPMVAPDGTSYHADQLVVEALDAIIEASGGEPPAGQLAISVPAHWDSAMLRAMRAAMRSNPSLAPNGVPARLVSDAVASLTALHANPGLPATGTAALLDFGGGGTSITLAAGDASFEPIETVRHSEFSGDQVDQLLLAHVLNRVGGSDGPDTAGTAAVSSLAALRESCCAAKERLSEDETATVQVDIPGHGGAIEVTRADLSGLLAEPLAGVCNALDDLLQRNKIAWKNVSSVVAVGGGARIPQVNLQLAEHLAARGAGGALVTTPQPALDAAVGAALFAVYGAGADAQTGMAPAAVLAGTAATDAVDAGPATAPAAITDLDLPTNTAADRVVKATGPALAWSDDDGGGDLLPYTGDDVFGDTTATRAIAQYVPPTGPATTEPSKAWQRLPMVVFGVTAIAAIAAIGGVTIVLTGDRKPAAPSPAPSASVAPPAAPTLPPPPPSTVTVTSEVPAPAPPPPPPPPPPSPTYLPPVTHAPAPTHTTTTHAPTTTPPPVTTTTEPPPPPPPTTTPEPTTTTTPTMTTSYIRLPFVPVPIPIQVPKGPDQPTETQAPANPYYPGQQYPGQQYPGQQYPQYPQQYPQYPQQYPQYPQ